MGPFKFYGPIIEYLTSPNMGYKLYNEQYPTLNPPYQLNRTNADLFVFPYDWRNSNWTSARHLKNFIDCIKINRGSASNFKVDIIAHSMGGLVARRYILNYNDHSVDRMMTLGTPWLGAPKTTFAIEDGNLGPEVNAVMNASAAREIAPHIRGLHELIPSKAYVDNLTGLNANSGDYPFGENHWDINSSSRRERIYSFNQLKSFFNNRYPRIHRERRPRFFITNLFRTIGQMIRQASLIIILSEQVTTYGDLIT